MKQGLLRTFHSFFQYGSGPPPTALHNTQKLTGGAQGAQMAKMVQKDFSMESFLIYKEMDTYIVENVANNYMSSLISRKLLKLLVHVIYEVFVTSHTNRSKKVDLKLL